MKRALDDLVVRYQKGYLSKRELLRYLNSLILKTPSRFHFHDRDLIYDFYAHVVAGLEELVKNYQKVNHSGFQAWFMVVLKREFFHYLWQFKREDLEPVAYDLYQNSLDHYSTISQDFRLVFDWNVLSEKEKNILSLKYGLPMGTSPIDQAVSIILRKLEKRKSLELKLVKRYRKMIKLQNMILEEPDPLEKSKLIKQEKEMKHYKRRLEKRFHGISILPTDDWVGRQLGLSGNTVSVYLYRIKKKVLKKRAS